MPAGSDRGTGTDAKRLDDYERAFRRAGGAWAGGVSGFYIAIAIFTDSTYRATRLMRG